MAKLKILKETTEPFSLRWKPSERAAIEKKAKKYTDGNITAWLIYAATNMVPPKKDVSADDEVAGNEEREQAHEV